MYNIRLSELEQELENFVENTTLLDLCYSPILSVDEKLKTYLSELSLLVPDFPFNIDCFYSHQEIFSIMLLTKDASFFQKKGVLEEIYNKVMIFASDKNFIASLPFFTASLNNLTNKMTNEDFINDMYNNDLEAYISLWDLMDNENYLNLYNQYRELFSLEFSYKINKVIKNFLSYKLEDLEKENYRKDLLICIEKSLNGTIGENSLNFYYNSYSLFKGFNQCYENGDLRDKEIEKYLKTRKIIKSSLYDKNIKHFDALNFSIREFLLANERNDIPMMRKVVDCSIIKRLEEMKMFLPNNQILISKFKNFASNERNKEGLREYLANSLEFLNDKSVETSIYSYNKDFENKRKEVSLQLFEKSYKVD